MAIPVKKRAYNTQNRQEHSDQVRRRILVVAKKLFQINGFEKVTIEAIAKNANISAPSVYAKFKSKRGILLAIIDSALPSEQHDALVEEIYLSKSAKTMLTLAAKLSRRLYEAEHHQMDWLRGAAIIDPLFRKLEQERENRRYLRQKKTVDLMAKQDAFPASISKANAKDILWALTGRDLYRMFVIERGWSPDHYEKWLAETLIKSLL